MGVHGAGGSPQSAVGPEGLLGMSLHGGTGAGGEQSAGTGTGRAEGGEHINRH